MRRERVIDFERLWREVGVEVWGCEGQWRVRVVMAVEWPGQVCALRWEVRVVREVGEGMVRVE